MNIYLKTYGCTHNRADSERMAGLLSTAGHRIVERLAAADAVIINGCAVKDPAEKRFWHSLARAQAAGKLVIAAGCVSQRRPTDPRLDGIPIVGVKEVRRVVEVLEAAQEGRIITAVSQRSQTPLDLPRRRSNTHIEIIPINDGCLGACSYCATVHARGRLRSHPREEIIAAIRAATRTGAREIWLTSEDVGAWGLDRDDTLPGLLNDIARIPGTFMVRIGMANPPFITRYVNELIALFRAHPDRFFRFLHLPVQSGSDRILAAMNRPYTASDFVTLADTLLATLPDITLMTDYIVGFPGETDEDFAATLALAQQRHCRILNINKFYPRPNTPAARMRHTPTRIVADRSRTLARWYEEWYDHDNPNAPLVGTTQDVLCTELGTKGRGIVGHTRNYTQVALPDASVDLLGTWQRVTITQARRYYLLGMLAPE